MTGHWKGGLAQVNVLLSTLLGGVSGSANADAAMQSKVLVPEMSRRGYDPAFSTAVTASSSIISVIIPPGIGLILYGFMGDVSIGRLFLAGVIPGVIICAAMMAAVAIQARRLNLEPAYEKPMPWAARGRAFVGAFLALMVPVGIVLGIRLGFFTPTEAGAMAVVFSIIVGIIYGDLKLRHVEPILEQTMAGHCGDSASDLPGQRLRFLHDLGTHSGPGGRSDVGRDGKPHLASVADQLAPDRRRDVH